MSRLVALRSAFSHSCFILGPEQAKTFQMFHIEPSLRGFLHSPQWFTLPPDHSLHIIRSFIRLIRSSASFLHLEHAAPYSSDFLESKPLLLLKSSQPDDSWTSRSSQAVFLSVLWIPDRDPVTNAHTFLSSYSSLEIPPQVLSQDEMEAVLQSAHSDL